MRRLPSEFRVAQEDPERADCLSFIHGFILRSKGVYLHLERVMGVKRSKKLNYEVNGQAVLAIWVLQKAFRLEVSDLDRAIVSPHLYESGSQFEKGGWRNYKFNPLDEDEFSHALELIDACLQIHASGA